MLSHEKPFFCSTPFRVGGLGANRIHGFHPWLLKLDSSEVLYVSHPERSEGSSHSLRMTNF